MGHPGHQMVEHSTAATLETSPAMSPEKLQIHIRMEHSQMLPNRYPHKLRDITSRDHVG